MFVVESKSGLRCGGFSALSSNASYTDSRTATDAGLSVCVLKGFLFFKKITESTDVCVLKRFLFEILDMFGASFRIFVAFNTFSALFGCETNRPNRCHPRTDQLPSLEVVVLWQSLPVSGNPLPSRADPQLQKTM